jgi:import inner membrane translocase subunit TIM23
MSSTPLKTIVLRWPSGAAAATRSTARIARSRPTAFYSTTASVSSTARPNSFLARPSALSICQPCRAATAAAARFALSSSTSATSRRLNSDLASSAQRSVDANGNRTAKSLGTAPGSPGPSPAASTEVPPSKPGSNSETATGLLTWDKFFALRLRRRRVQLVFSVLNSVGVGMAGVVALTMGLAEPVMKQVPLDPFLTLGLVTTASAALGWLTGPSVGAALFYRWNRGVMQQMKRKESEFLEKVKKNRADPTNSSTSNPGMHTLISNLSTNCTLWTCREKRKC